MEQSKAPSLAIIKASFDLEANKQNYQLLLNNLSAITVTRDNVNDDLTKDGRQIIKQLTDKKDLESEAPIKWHKSILSVYKELADPIKEQIDRISSEKKVISLQIQEETRRQLAEQSRIANAKQAIVDFTNKVANAIRNSSTDADIVAIEKMIGAEKTKKNLYQEFLPQLIEQCDGLRPQIKDQKENIRRLQAIEEKEKAALANGEIYEATALREEKELIQAVIEETGIRIHEKAYEQATTIDIVAPDVVDTAPKGRTNWKWRVDDIKLLQKKMPHLVKLVPDEDAIDLLLATKRADGSLKDKMEENLFGLTFFNDKTFK